MRPLPFAAVVLGLLASATAVSAFYTTSGPVVALDPSNFQTKIKSGGVWLVEFYAPWCGHCKSLKPEYEKTAAALKGIVNIAAVDCDQHQAIGAEYGIKGFPTIKLFYADESGKIKHSEYTGGRTAKDMVTFAADKAKAYALKKLGAKPSASDDRKAQGEKKPGSGSGGGGSGGGGKDPFYSGTDVMVLSDANFEEIVINSPDLWLVEFYAPWCGHCKNLKPEYIEAASSLKGKAKLGAINCDDNKGVCGEYGIKGFPTIKFFGANKRSPEDYNQARDASAMVSFATAKWNANTPPPEVHELVETAVFERECIGNSDDVAAKQLCILSFLPDILDSKASGRKAYIKSLKKVAEGFKDRPFSFLWAEGGRQLALEQSVGVGGFGYPAAVALNPRDKKYSTLKGAFSASALKDWIDAIRKGGEAVAPVTGGTLGAVESTTPWDGKDAAVKEEEEFSLDDIMNEL